MLEFESGNAPLITKDGIPRSRLLNEGDAHSLSKLSMVFATRLRTELRRWEPQVPNEVLMMGADFFSFMTVTPEHRISKLFRRPTQDFSITEVVVHARYYMGQLPIDPRDDEVMMYDMVPKDDRFGIKPVCEIIEEEGGELVRRRIWGHIVSLASGMLVYDVRHRLLAIQGGELIFDPKEQSFTVSGLQVSHRI